MDSEIVDSKAVDADYFDFDNILNKDDYKSGFLFCIIDTPVNIVKRVVEDLRGMENHVFNQKGNFNQIDVIF